MLTIKNIQIAGENSLFIEFSDGKTKLVNLKMYFNMGIFSQLSDPDYFELVKNNGYFVALPNDQELSAETLHYSL